MRFLFGLTLAASVGYSAQLPLFFFPNTGQADSSVQYIVQTPDLSARFRPDGAIFQSNQHETGVRFVGANPRVAITGAELLPAKINFFLGTSGWTRDVPSYSKILYRGLYSGIDMTYGGTGSQIKSEFLVAPGADPSLIRLEYSEPVSIDAAGNLVVGDFREAAPEIYQGHVKVAGRYRVLDAHTVGFEIDSYDASAPLVIDPTVSYATYLGGSGSTAITGVAVDASGFLYVTGWTAALNFPVNGGFQASNQGGDDVIVAKLNQAGTGLLYATYIGGRANDQGAAIAVDSLGQAYVTGSTSSSNFPLVLSNRAGLGGASAAFALKLNATGNILLYSGYLGGTVYETGAAIALDANSNAYIAGTTQSSNFPTVNPTQAFIGGGADVFVTELNSAGTITFSTFLGGSGNEEAGGIAVDVNGNIFVAGGTASANFPVVSPIQGAIAGTQDAFVTKINSGRSIGFSTFLGGSGGSPQQASAIALDSAGNPYITGVTTSTNFPITSGAFQTVLNGLENAFVTKLSGGGVLAYSTYLGGSSFDWGYAIAVSSAGNAYIAGNTSSVDFPTLSPVQAANNGLYDAFVTELNFNGRSLLFSTYYGGSNQDSGSAIAVDTSANIYLGGQTSSANLAVVTPIQSSIAASSTGWVMRLGVTGVPPTQVATVAILSNAQAGNGATFTTEYTDTGGGSTITTALLLVSASSSTANACYITYSPANNLFSLYSDSGTTVAGTVTPGSGSAQNDQCILSGLGSSATVSGTGLSVTFVLTFLPAFAGAKNVYLQAMDSTSITNLNQGAGFTVTTTSGIPQVISVSPSAGSGLSQTFTLVYNNTISSTSLNNLAVLFAISTNPVNSCYVAVNPQLGTVSLFSDNTSTQSSTSLGSSIQLQNSQCIIGATTAVQGGTAITVTMAVSFKTGFNGLRNIYMEASTSSANTGFVAMGTFSIPTPGTPATISAVPGSGFGPSERFSFTLADPAGASLITSGAILFASTFNMNNACYMIWDGTKNTVSITFDNPANGQTQLTPGQPGIATNEQCTLNAANSTVVVGATQVIITLDLTFNSTFFGAKNIYLLAAEQNASSGWNSVGTWTVTGGASTANSMAPSSGAGSSATFVFTVSDSTSPTNLSGMSMLFTTGPPTVIANACYLVFTRTINVQTTTIGLWDNTGNTTLSTKLLGSSANLLNSQCAVGTTTQTVVGDSVQFAIQIVFFKPAFSGPKSVYLNATEPNSGSGFVYMGSWTVQ
jgi:hypothetical protein